MHDMQALIRKHATCNHAHMWPHRLVKARRHNNQLTVTVASQLRRCEGGEEPIKIGDANSVMVTRICVERQGLSKYQNQYLHTMFASCVLKSLSR